MVSRFLVSVNILGVFILVLRNPCSVTLRHNLLVSQDTMEGFARAHPVHSAQVQLFARSSNRPGATSELSAWNTLPSAFPGGSHENVNLVESRENRNVDPTVSTPPSSVIHP